MSATRFRYFRVTPPPHVLDDGEGWDVTMAALRPFLDSLPASATEVMEHVSFDGGDLRDRLSHVAERVSSVAGHRHEPVEWSVRGVEDLDMAAWLTRFGGTRSDGPDLDVVVVQGYADGGEVVIMPAVADLAGLLRPEGIRVSTI